MAAERTSESLFLAMPTYDCFDHTKRIRRDSHQLPSIDIANSFSYSSGFELSSPNFASNSFQEKDTNCVDQSTLHSNGSLAKYSRNQAFEAFYSSLKASDLSSYIGFNSILSGNARSIQNGEFSTAFICSRSHRDCIFQFRDQNFTQPVWLKPQYDRARHHSFICIKIPDSIRFIAERNNCSKASRKSLLTQTARSVAESQTNRDCPE